MDFIRTFCTNTRLMGTMMLLIEWLKDEKVVSHIFMLDAEGLGVSDFYAMYGESEHNRENFYRQKYGGLGGKNIEIEKEEAIFLVNYYMQKNIKYEKPLPESFNIDIQEFYSKEYKNIGIDESNEFLNSMNNSEFGKNLFKKICKKIESENEFVNYMIMRLVARDRESLLYFSENESVANTHITNINGALLYNEIEKKSEDRFVCKCVYEDNDGYYESKIIVTIDKLLVDSPKRNLYENFKYEYFLRSFMIANTNGIYDFQVFDIISKNEILDIYNINNLEKHKEIEFKIYNSYPAIQGIEFENGELYIQYYMDNSHVDNDVYVINNDIMFIVYVNEKNIFLATYNEQSREMIEESLSNQLGSIIEKNDTLYFEQNVLFDFVESGNDDFYDFIN